jgi:hypothetical protein
VLLPPTIDDPPLHLLELYGGQLAAIDVPEIRRTVTETDPMAFALTYLWHHLSSPQTGSEVTLSRYTSTGRGAAGGSSPGHRSGGRSSPPASSASRPGTS